MNNDDDDTIMSITYDFTISNGEIISHKRELIAGAQ